MQNVDDQFYGRADAHIDLSNQQISPEIGHGKVSSSMMYAAARFNSWVSATGWRSSAEMAASKQETIDYFVDEYRKMLDENLQDYIDNFERYMRPDTSQ